MNWNPHGNFNAIFIVHKSNTSIFHSLCTSHISSLDVSSSEEVSSLSVVDLSAVTHPSGNQAEQRCLLQERLESARGTKMAIKRLTHVTDFWKYWFLCQITLTISLFDFPSSKRSVMLIGWRSIFDIFYEHVFLTIYTILGWMVRTIGFSTLWRAYSVHFMKIGRLSHFGSKKKEG